MCDHIAAKSSATQSTLFCARNAMQFADNRCS
ncbi:Uncharacterised protein [Vibrio cholerae]|nr:Uncharacterised protein [Vibrio cholerae]CSI65993.1 Uncharacterised protein [Vibrio cholerae]CSI70969.1 Uncharacterised protein [Vibrio cholerae]